VVRVRAVVRMDPAFERALLRIPAQLRENGPSSSRESGIITGSRGSNLAL